MTDRKFTEEEISEVLESANDYDLIRELEYRGIYTEDEDSVLLENASDDQLIDELRFRNYDIMDEDLAGVVQRWLRGDKKEALFLLERSIPELHGVSKLV
jgi:hypothetical protein